MAATGSSRFFWGTSLANTINKYGHFSYSVNEALHLSEKEEAIILNIIQNIEHEYHSNIDQFSQNLIIAQLEDLNIRNHSVSYSRQKQNVRLWNSDSHSIDCVSKADSFCLDNVQPRTHTTATAL
ncbi:MAG: hypothetical protein ABIN89_27160 [Chitinophagaceae bacterium]